jgi:hypothetical protein
MKEKRLERVERRRPMVEINLGTDSRSRQSWAPLPKLSQSKRGPGVLKRLLGLGKG